MKKKVSKLKKNIIKNYKILKKREKWKTLNYINKESINLKCVNITLKIHPFLQKLEILYDPIRQLIFNIIFILLHLRKKKKRNYEHEVKMNRLFKTSRRVKKENKTFLWN